MYWFGKNFPNPANLIKKAKANYIFHHEKANPNAGQKFP